MCDHCDQNERFSFERRNEKMSELRVYFSLLPVSFVLAFSPVFPLCIVTTSITIVCLYTGTFRNNIEVQGSDSHQTWKSFIASKPFLV